MFVNINVNNLRGSIRSSFLVNNNWKKFIKEIHKRIVLSKIFNDGLIEDKLHFFLEQFGHHIK